MDQITQDAFMDEFAKIAEGYFLRSGRRPITVERLIEKDQGTPSEAFEATEETVDVSESEKTSAANPGVMKGITEVLGKHKRDLGLAAASAGTYHVARKANEDRKLGRQIRLQGG